MKKEQDVCILAHAYQSQDILEVADYMGDSYGLSVQASKSKCKNVIMCGVRFMAETCKVLSPHKRVWLANPIAELAAIGLATFMLVRYRKRYGY